MASGRPLFLGRQTYRLRRVMDAARLLPILGFFLFLLPILWGHGASVARSTATDALYLFIAWPLLILAAFVIARVLAPVVSAEEAEERDDPDGGAAR
ncbi:MAG: hypothetical protein KGK00_11725 [Paracoccaceae bacterium]|nr:hypothetical protein [Paracoccaceae bacterium]MDE3237645.1 hypothetical protein [Paracoccaceae bacterium]